MFKWLTSLFKSKESKPERSFADPIENPTRYRPDAAVSRSPARTAKSQLSSARRVSESNSRPDDYLSNPLNPIGFNSPIYYDSSPSYSSSSSCSSSSSSSSYDSSSSSDGCSSSSSSSD